MDLSERTDNFPVADDDVAALEKVFVGLRIVEPADYGPYGVDGGGDGSDHGGAAPVVVVVVGTDSVGVVMEEVIGDRDIIVSRRRRHGEVSGECGGVVVVDSVELKC